MDIDKSFFIDGMKRQIVPATRNMHTCDGLIFEEQYIFSIFVK